MEKFKIELFENETNKKFPFFKELTEQEIKVIKVKLCFQFNLSEQVTNLDLVKVIDNIQLDLKNFDANESFSIIKCLAFLGIKNQEKLLVNWYQFDKVDEFYFNDLETYFADIWYPSADDIDIFDNTLTWILSIRHDGNVKYWKA